MPATIEALISGESTFPATASVQAITEKNVPHSPPHSNNRGSAPGRRLRKALYSPCVSFDGQRLPPVRAKRRRCVSSIPVSHFRNRNSCTESCAPLARQNTHWCRFDRRRSSRLQCQPPFATTCKSTRIGSQSTSITRVQTMVERNPSDSGENPGRARSQSRLLQGPPALRLTNIVPC